MREAAAAQRRPGKMTLSCDTEVSDPVGTLTTICKTDCTLHSGSD